MENKGKMVPYDGEVAWGVVEGLMGSLSVSVLLWYEGKLSNDIFANRVASAVMAVSAACMHVQLKNDGTDDVRDMEEKVSALSMLLTDVVIDLCREMGDRELTVDFFERYNRNLDNMALELKKVDEGEVDEGVGDHGHRRLAEAMMRVTKKWLPKK